MAGAGVGGRRRGSEMGGEGGRDGTPVPVLVPAKMKTQVEYTEWSHTLGVFLLHELEYIPKHNLNVTITRVLSL